MSKPELKLDWCSHEAAKYAVQKWHYSRTMPAGKMVRVGVWEGGRFVGCVLFSRGGTPHLSAPYGLSQTEACELTRVALAIHQAPVSRILSVALRLLRRLCPGLRLVVSFADTARGHHGGIYQAGGWLYAGFSSPEKYLLIGGRVVHPRTAVSVHGTRSPGRLGASVVVKPGKHRYLYPLDPEMRSRVAPLAKPYPKRAAGVAGDTPPDHGGEAGSTPSAALSDP